MSRQTSRGEAPVARLCVTFSISRAAYYAAKERMRTEPCSGAKSNVVRLPRRPNVASAEQVLVAVRKIIQGTRRGASGRCGPCSAASTAST
jgi:hypothetical protein